MRTIATLIARGGSKRLPRKNVLPFCGLPLMAWTIIQAKCSRLVDEVWLSTDDDEIQEIGEEYGAIVVRRPDWPDADTVSAGRPMRHALEAALEVGPVDCAVSALVTNPLRKPDDLDRVVAKYYQTRPDVVAAIIPQRETVLFEFVDDCVQFAIFDKTYRYAISVGGSGANNPRYSLNDINRSDVSGDTKKVMTWIETTTGPVMPYVIFEIWQGAETDTREEFEFCEVLMEHYILQGRGRTVYDEYATQFNTRRKQ